MVFFVQRYRGGSLESLDDSLSRADSPPKTVAKFGCCHSVRQWLGHETGRDQVTTPERARSLKYAYRICRVSGAMWVGEKAMGMVEEEGISDRERVSRDRFMTTLFIGLTSKNTSSTATKWQQHWHQWRVGGGDERVPIVRLAHKANYRHVQGD